VASEWGSKGKTLPADGEQLERHTKMKLCRELQTINIGSRKFIQLNWSSGLAFILNFPEKV
jgi:hypothetical protein